jgi:hypothetical protein
MCSSYYLFILSISCKECIEVCGKNVFIPTELQVNQNSFDFLTDIQVCSQ